MDQAKLILADLMDMVHSGMNEGEYTNIMDHILDTIDPEDQEYSFLEVAKTWRDLMGKVHGENQTWDQY